MEKVKPILIFSMMAIFLLSGVAKADWVPANGHKMHYPQMPDPDGWDVSATVNGQVFPPLVLADDFLCTESGYIRDIHFWGSWRDGITSPINGFYLSIHADIPADPPSIPYSRPLDPPLWEMFVGTDDIITAGPFPGLQGWYDPLMPDWLWPDHMEYFQYNIFLDNFLDEEDLFWQEESTIYWLNITADIYDPFSTAWGWKTTLDPWNDGAVWSIFPPSNTWEPLSDPGGFTLDLAFVITGDPDQPTVYPVEETVCPVMETQCPVTETKCPTADTECPVIETECPEIPTVCTGDQTHCPVDPTNCPVVETQCPAVGPTTCPEIATECPEIVTECPYEYTTCPEYFTYCPEDITICPIWPTECPMEPTFCPMDITLCEFTICDDIPTWCPDEPTLCPVIPTSCPTIPTVCPITPVSTVCPEIATECPATVTECQIIPTECPDDPTYCTTADTDADGINDCLDNCIYTPNGYLLGTCAEAIGPLYKGTVTCTSGSDCGTGEVCQMSQEDCNSNGAGDVCECYADFDGDGNVYPSDLSVFLGEYGRTNCLTTPPPCQADFDNDGNVYPSDLSLFLQEYGRTDCPPTI